MSDNEKKVALFFTFRLGNDMYAMEVTAVKEVLVSDSITVVPRTLPYMKGVMNIRGSVVSIIDLRTLLNFDSSLNNDNSSIIVAEIVDDEEQATVLGIMADEVDGVTELVNVKSDSFTYGEYINHNFVKALAKKGDEFVMILDLSRILLIIEEELSQNIKEPILEN